MSLAWPTPVAEAGAVAIAIIPTKAAIRNDALKRRDGIDAESRVRFAIRLAQIGPGLVQNFGTAQPAVASVFAAIGSEPDPLPLALALQAAGCPLVLPVDWSHGSALVYRRWSPGDPLGEGPLGIAEPGADAPELEPDVLFVPLAAFDRAGRRLGYGAGNVDRTVKALRGRKPVRVVGIAYGVQEVPFVPSEAHDEPADMIVTDTDILVCPA